MASQAAGGPPIIFNGAVLKASGASVHIVKTLLTYLYTGTLAVERETVYQLLALVGMFWWQRAQRLHGRSRGDLRMCGLYVRQPGKQVGLHGQRHWPKSQKKTAKLLHCIGHVGPQSVLYALFYPGCRPRAHFELGVPQQKKATNLLQTAPPCYKPVPNLLQAAPTCCKLVLNPLQTCHKP